MTPLGNPGLFGKGGLRKNVGEQGEKQSGFPARGHPLALPKVRDRDQPMSEDNIYVIGDIHGCLAPLKRLLEHLEPDLHQDRLLFVGDYIDRGPDSRGVVDYILALKTRYPAENIICLKGNHEVMFLDFLEGKDRQLFLFNGGRNTIENYWGEGWREEDNLRLPLDHERFYRGLLPFYATSDYVFVHGGLKPGIPLDQQVDGDLYWIRGGSSPPPRILGAR